MKINSLWISLFMNFAYFFPVAVESVGENNSDWMSKLSKKLVNAPLMTIAIPGSHDSASYSLSYANDLAPDVPRKILQFLKISNNISGGTNFVKEIVYRWSITQTCNITRQLYLGIRYLDMRIIYKKGKIYTHHGLIGANLEDILQEVQRFIEKHKKELILLDFNHMLQMNVDAFTFLNFLLNKTFGEKMYEFEESDTVTLQNAWRLKKNIIVFYQYIHARQKHMPKFVWNHSKIVAPFRKENFYSTNTWLNFLDNEFKRREKNKFFVTQGILQPHWIGIVSASLAASGTLEKWVSDDATKSLVSWLHSYNRGSNKINIVIADFVEKNNFIPSVLEVNNFSPSLIPTLISLFFSIAFQFFIHSSRQM